MREPIKAGVQYSDVEAVSLCPIDRSQFIIFLVIGRFLQSGMPSKSRKTRCCTGCGRRSKGHLGQTGVKCRMDELIQQELDVLSKLPDANSEVSEERDHSPAVSVDAHTVTGADRATATPSVQDQLTVLTTQVGLLVTTLSKLTANEVHGASGASRIAEKSSGTPVKASSGKAGTSNEGAGIVDGWVNGGKI
jgi:hypothetical protein